MNSMKGDEIEALAEDLRYFEALVKDDAQSLQARIIEAVEASPNPYDHLKAVTGVLVENQANLAARIKVLEQVLLGKAWAGPDSVKVGGQPVAEHNYAPQAQVRITAESFGLCDNMYGVEHTGEGLAYSWTGPSPEIVFDVPVLRDVEKVFRLGFISAMDDDELIKEEQIFVDGQSQRVELDFDGQTRGLRCTLPIQDGSQISRIEVKLVRTLSPAELGRGGDERKLGLAITGYEVLTMEAESL